MSKICTAALLAWEKYIPVMTEAELEMLRANGTGQPDPAWKVLKVAVTRFMTDCEMLPLDPAALIPEKTRIMANIERLEKWTDMMRIAMAGTVPGEGAVE